MKRSISSSWLLLFVAAVTFAVAPGCDSETGGDTSANATADDHDHDGHDHGHDDHGHDHDGHDHGDHGHDHDGHDHGDHDGHDHGDHDGHDHGDHDGHDHDGHDHDIESLGAAVEKIEGLHKTIIAKLAEGDLDAAHGPMHDIGTVLIATEGYLEENNQGAKQADLQAAVETILDSVGEVDELLHVGGEIDVEAVNKKYVEVSSSVDEAIATLKVGG